MVHSHSDPVELLPYAWTLHTETSFSQGLSTFKLSQRIVHSTFHISKVAFPYSLLLLGILLSFPLSSPSVKYRITTATHGSHFFLWVMYHSALLPHIKYMSVLPTWESSSLYSPWHLLWGYFLGIIPSQNLFFPVHTWYAWDSYLVSKDNQWLGVLTALDLSVQIRASSRTLACIIIAWKTLKLISESYC